MLVHRYNAAAPPTTPAKGTGVWCTRCCTNLRAHRDAVKRHFEAEHGKPPSPDELKRVLANTSEQRSDSAKIARMKQRGVPVKDPEREHAIRWGLQTIQAGNPGSRRRR